MSRLSQSPAWLALLGYQSGSFSNAVHSQADRPDFFVSPEGVRDPLAELLAERATLFGDDDQAVLLRCRFPARFIWLQQQLGLLPQVQVLKECTALRDWYESLAMQSISIAFASSYLENPSSTFGHTFLRFQTANTPTLLTPTINYAADSGQVTDPLSFIIKGLVGGFPGVADRMPLFRRLRIYGDNEGRDIWEYPLALDADQIRMLLLSLWEQRNGAYNYYFLDENCSYRTLALIGVTVPQQDLLRPFWLDVVPVETIKLLRQRGLAASGQYRASSIRTLYWHMRDFSDREQQQVVQLARGNLAPQDLASTPEARRALILVAAAEYTAILINRGQLDLDTRDRVMHGLIVERLRLSQVPPPDPVPPPQPPEATHGGHFLSAGWVDHQGIQGAELGIAGFQHTLIDPLPGYQAGAAITVLGARVRFEQAGNRELESLDLLKVESNTPSNRLFQQPVWSLAFGAQRKYVKDSRPLVGTLSYATGYAVDTAPGVLSLRLGANFDTAAALRAGVGLEGALRVDLSRQTTMGSYRFYFEEARYLLGEDSRRHEYGLQLGIPLQRELSLEFDLGRAGAKFTQTQVGVHLRKFF
ncbi:MAG: DUF4105 domain-containing protein [Pseudomonadota bacterium]